MSAVVMLEVEVKDGMVTDLIQLLKQYLPDTRKYSGFIRIAIHVEENSNRVVFLSEWDRREDYDAYLQWRVETGVMDIIGKTLKGAPAIRYFLEDACRAE